MAAFNVSTAPVKTDFVSS